MTVRTPFSAEGRIFIMSNLYETEQRETPVDLNQKKLVDKVI
jgi:hypothetical protein